MQYLLLGLAALLLFLLATRAYTMANPQVLARQLRVGAGVAGVSSSKESNASPAAGLPERRSKNERFIFII